MTVATKSRHRQLFSTRLANLLTAAAISAVIAASAISAGFPGTLESTRFHDIFIGLLFGLLWLSVSRSIELSRQNRKQYDTEQSLSARERQLRNLIDAVPVLISYVNKEQRYQVCNKAYEEWFGTTAQQIAGQHVCEVLGEEDYKFCLPYIREVLQGTTVRFESTLNRGSRKVRHVDRTFIPSIGNNGEIEGFFVCVTDITDRKWREGEIVRSKRAISDIVESLQEGFAVCDEDDRLVVSNQNYSEIFPTVADLIKPGVKFEELIRAAADRGQNVDALGSREAWIQRRLEAHTRARGLFEHCFTDGRWVWVEEKKTSDGKTLSTYVDITQLKQREEELLRARDQAQTADATKSEFLANMSHELRTPLNAIMGFAEIISKQLLGPVSEQYAGYAQNILTSGEHLLSIVNQILDLSKIEAGGLELVEELIDVEELIASSALLVRDHAGTRGIDVTVSTAPGLPPLWGDNLRLKQMVLNLLSNAIKFTPSGGRVRADVRTHENGDLRMRLCLESGGNWFWRLSERVESCGGQAARSRVSSAIS